MFKKFLNLIKGNKEDKNEKEIVENKVLNDDVKANVNENEVATIVGKNEKANIEKEINEEIIDTIKNSEKMYNESVEDEDLTESNNKVENKNEEIDIDNYEFDEVDLEYIKHIKIQRGKAIKAIDVYSNEEIIFETHQECSKKLRVPIEYIKENLEYGYTDYFGQAIKYLGKSLRIDILNLKSEGKNIVEIFNYMHNQLWSESVCEKRREDILSSNKIEPIKMHYRFETIDDEYDDYFRIYGKLIRRGGKKE